MYFSVELKKRLYEKFGGRCAYTGQPLGEDWQVDHMTPRQQGWRYKGVSLDVEGNLVPACKIINHYKRDKDVEGFREYIATLLQRIRGYHKKDGSYKKGKENVCKYLEKVAEMFGISEEKPFDGTFYFERVFPGMDTFRLAGTEKDDLVHEQRRIKRQREELREKQLNANIRKLKEKREKK